MTDRPLEPDEPPEPTQPTEPVEPTEATEATEPTEATEQTEGTEQSEATEQTEPEARELEAADEPDEETTETTAPEEATTVAPAAPVEEKRLRRSRNDRVIAGVCGGLGKYLGVDPVLVRIAAVLLVFAGGVGIVLYGIGWLAMDEEPETFAATGGPTRSAAESELERKRGALLLGLVFVALGVYFLLDDFWPDVSWQYVWPLALIAVGVAIVARRR